MSITETLDAQDSLLQAFLSDEQFWPSEPRSLEEAGVSISLVESLVCKYLAVAGMASGRGIADHLGLPYLLLEGFYDKLRTQQMLCHSGSAPFNDYYFVLTEQGKQRAEAYQKLCAYVGPTPVALKDYLISVEAQCINTENVTEEALRTACADISVSDHLYDLIGPAVNSGAGMFLFGAPGNGKTTLAKRITRCFGQHVWIPRALTDDGQIIKLFDASFHKELNDAETSVLKAQTYDQRWVRIERPAVAVGGELTMDKLDLRHDPATNVCEAPLQLKSNCGCLVIDDFGRQRVPPEQLLNRWIVPLESACDYLTLPTGKTIEVPFEQLIVFSTNLEPRELVDEAFLRRIPYKIEIGDPSKDEFFQLFEIYAGQYGCAYQVDAVEQLLERHYVPQDRRPRRCHPRDLLKQVRNYCRYRRLPFEMHPEYLDHVVQSYFAMVMGKEQPPHQDTCAVTD